jgi:hypothetical protein
MHAGALDLAPSFYNLISSLFRFLNVNPYATLGPHAFMVDELPEVWSVSNEEQLERLLARRMSTRIPEVLRQVRQKGSWFVADRNVIVAQEFRVPWAAEQAARFVYQVCQGSGSPPDITDDQFYGDVLSSALALLGAQFLCPSRKLYDRAQLETDTRTSVEQYTPVGMTKRACEQTLEWVIEQVGAGTKRCRRSRSASATPKLDATQRNHAATVLGYLLGSDLYSAYVRGSVSKRFLRMLFFKDLSKPGAARALYTGTRDRMRLA